MVPCYKTARYFGLKKKSTGATLEHSIFKHFNSPPRLLIHVPGVQIVERERKIKRAKEREKKEGRLGERTRPSFFFSRSFARFIFRSRSTIRTPGTGYSSPQNSNLSKQ